MERIYITKEIDGRKAWSIDVSQKTWKELSELLIRLGRPEVKIERKESGSIAGDVLWFLAILGIVLFMSFPGL